jgi:hypothetical protein
VKVIPKKKLTSGEELKNDIIRFYGKRFGKVGEIVAEYLLLSLISLKCERIIKEKNLGILNRYRIHCLLCWDVGRAKSRFLTEMKMGINQSELFSARTLSDCSAEALRGGVNKAGDFVVPEFRMSDIIILPEMSSMMKSKDDIAVFNNLLTSLEDGEFRVKLLKLGGIKQEVKDFASKWGVIIGDGDMTYNSDSIMWMATYDLNILPESVRNAIMDRFLVVNLDLKNFPIDWVIYVMKQPDIKSGDMEWLGNKITDLLGKVDVDEFTIKRAKLIVEDIVNEYSKLTSKKIDEKINLRLVGDIIRITVAELSIRSEEEKLVGIKTYVKDKFEKIMHLDINLDNVLYEYVERSSDNGVVVPELEETTGFSRNKINSLLNDLMKLHLIKRNIIKDNDVRLNKYRRVKYVYKVIE